MSGIEWTDVSWNPVRGCSRVSEGCRNCYAERRAARFSGTKPPEVHVREREAPFHGFARTTPAGPRWTGRVELIPSKLDEPLHWKKPRRVFVNSMSDLFHETLPDGAILRVFEVMDKCPQHTFQILTKRPQRMLEFRADSPSSPNVWLGVSCEDQKAADERIPLLRQTPAAVRFISVEPMLEQIDLCLEPGMEVSAPDGARRGIHWVICGGESGPGARPCDVAWIRSVLRQCREAGVPCFIKQLGARPHEDVPSRSAGTSVGFSMHLRDPKGGDPAEWPEDLRVREFPS